MWHSFRDLRLNIPFLKLKGFYDSKQKMRSRQQKSAKKG